MEGYITNRKFSNSLWEQRYELMEKYKDPEWDYVKSKLSETQQITKSAVIISENMKNHFGIELFPYIQKIATKGFDIGGGTYAFCMYEKAKQFPIYFDLRAKFYKAKNGVYEYLNDDRDTIITRTK